MTNATKNAKSLNAEEVRLINSRRMLIAGMDRVAERLESRSYALSGQEVCQLCSQLDRLQQRLGDVNDRLLDLKIQKARRYASSFRVTFPDVDNAGERKTRRV